MVAVFTLSFMCVYCNTSLATDDKSGVKPQVLKLPSGPGSIVGLGESFQAQLNSGTGSYAVPFKVLPGRAGFAPNIGLQYNGGHGNSEVGLGWKLNVSKIQRQTSKGLPVYNDTRDRFINNQSEELIEIDTGVFRAENESLFERYEKVTASDGKLAWQVKHRDGTVSYYGETSSSRLQNGELIFAWYLSRQVDVNGNTIYYLYNQSSAFANNTQPNDLIPYLTTISYNHAGNNNKMEVALSYESRQAGDRLLDYRSRLPVTITQRLSTVTMRAAGERVRSYSLAYQASSVLSRLESVSTYGQDLAQGALPSVLSFGYNDFNLSTEITAMDQGTAPGEGLSLSDVDLADINGDALPDILYTGDSHAVYFNLDGESWSTPETLLGGFSEFKLNQQNTMLMDMNGDGLTDLLSQDLSINGYKYFAGSPSSNTWLTTPVEMANTPSFNFDSVTKPLDVNNDGKIDVLRKAAGSFELTLVFNQQGSGLSNEYSMDPPSLKSEFNFANGLQLADMNGDGLQDFVVFNQAGEIWYYPSKGVTFDASTPNAVQGWDSTAKNWPQGVSGAEGIWLGNAPNEIDDSDFNSVSKFRQIKLVDINGDGLNDLVYIANNRVKAWLNFGGEYVSDIPLSLTTNIPDLTANTYIRMADMNGNGTVDIVWNRDTGFIESGSATANWVYLDLTAGVKPNLLNRIDNGIGKVTTIEYKSAVSDRIDDRKAGNEWHYKLPIAVNVLSQITIDDGLNQYTTRFKYQHGYYDGEEKAFRGFENAQRFEVGDSSAPTLVSDYQYHTGAMVKALKGKPVTLSAENQSGSAFYNESYLWKTRTLHTGSVHNEKTVTFAYQEQKDRVISEKETGSPVSLRWRYEYDNYGNNTKLTEFGRLDAGWNDERVTQTVYSASCANGRENWILNKPISVVKSDESATEQNKVFRTIHKYDGNNESCQLTKGNLTESQIWQTGDDYVVSVRNEYDSDGNIIKISDPLYSAGGNSHYREIVYDAVFNTFAVEEKIHVSADNVLSLTAQYNVGLGEVTRSTDFNGHSTRYEYDNFGRIVSITKPLDTLPTIEYSYVLATDIGNGTTINYVETRQRENAVGGIVASRKFFDGLGRHVMTRSQGEFANQVVVSDTVQFNARQTAHRKYLPYFETHSGAGNILDYVAPTYTQNYTSHEYDALGREVKMTQPDGSFSTSTYAPLKRIVKDEEQTRETGKHAAGAMIYEEDGLLDKNGKGRLRNVTEVFAANQQWLTQYHYDLNDNLTGYIDSQGNQKIMRYDGLSRKTFMNDPDRGEMVYEYDDASNLIKTIDAKNQHIQMTYDGANRILAEYYSAEKISNALTPDVEYAYDTAFGAQSVGQYWQNVSAQTLGKILVTGTDTPLDYDINGDSQFDVADVLAAKNLNAPGASKVSATNTRGQLTRVKDNAGEIHFSYDARSRKTWSIRTINDHLAHAHRFYTGYQYDSMDRITQLIYPDQSRVDYKYNSRGLLETVPGAITEINYNAAGQNALLRYHNDIEINYGYDDRLRLDSLVSTRTQDEQTLQHLSYQYDAVSNIVGITDGRSNRDLEQLGQELNLSAAQSHEYNASQSFSYDNLYRLTKAHNNAVYGSIDYDYDQIGNMISKTAVLTGSDKLINLGVISHGGELGAHNRIGRNKGAAPGPHAITGTTLGGGENGASAVTIAYDDNGNTIAERGQTYTWDYKDRLVAMNKADTVGRYSYDYSDSRKYKVVKNSAQAVLDEVFYIDKHSEVRDGVLTKYIYAGSQRIARTKDNTASPQTYYLHDHLGSTNLALDANATVTEHLVNYPFGRVRLAANQQKQSDYRFTGKETDTESELQYFEARYLGVANTFMSVDPKEFGASKIPGELNRYSYVRNSPVRNFDPDGYDLVDSSVHTLSIAMKPIVEGFDSYAAETHSIIEEKGARLYQEGGFINLTMAAGLAVYQGIIPRNTMEAATNLISAVAPMAKIGKVATGLTAFSSSYISTLDQQMRSGQKLNNDKAITNALIGTFSDKISSDVGKLMGHVSKSTISNRAATSLKSMGIDPSSGNGQYQIQKSVSDFRGYTNFVDNLMDKASKTTAKGLTEEN